MTARVTRLTTSRSVGWRRERAAQHAVLAHQILDRAHLFFLAPAMAFLSGEDKAGIPKSLARLLGCPLSRKRGQEGRLDRVKLTMPRLLITVITCGMSACAVRT